MKRIDQVSDSDVFLDFHCEECHATDPSWVEGHASINPSELVHSGVPMCPLHGEMVFVNVEVVVREDQ